MEERSKNKMVELKTNEKSQLSKLSGFLNCYMKTDRCHPHVNFPSDRDILHTNNHWSNTSTVLRLIDKENKRCVGLPKPYSYFYIFWPHHTSKVQQKLSESNTLFQLIAQIHCMLQSPDLSVNKPLKMK